MEMGHFKNPRQQNFRAPARKTNQKLNHAAFETLEKRMMLKTGNGSIRLRKFCGMAE